MQTTNKTALIIVPYRDREEHLYQFIPAMWKYWAISMPRVPEILIVEQADDKPFNRAKLLNAAVHQANISGGERVWDYYIFHDVDMLPIEVDYSFPHYPTQLAKSNIQINNYLGGVTMFSREDFLQLDGYSNNFWGWGGEDNEMFNRISNANLPVTKRFGKFVTLPHEKNGSFDKQKWAQAQRQRHITDGLSACEFELVENALINPNGEFYYRMKVLL